MLPEQIAQIRLLAENRVYPQVSKLTGIPLNEVHWRGQCSLIANRILPVLGELNFRANIINTTSNVQNTHHDYVETFNIDDAERWIIDGGWQFWLKQPNPQLPKVLVCQRKDIVTQLEQYGISGFTKYYWLARPTDLQSDLGISYRELEMAIEHGL